MKTQNNNATYPRKATLALVAVILTVALLSINAYSYAAINDIIVNEYYGHHEIIASIGATIRIYEGSSTYEYENTGRPLYYKSNSNVFSVMVYDENSMLLGTKDIGPSISDKPISSQRSGSEDNPSGSSLLPEDSTSSFHNDFRIRGKNSVQTEILVRSSGKDEGYRSPGIMGLGKEKIDVLIRPYGMAVREIVIEKYNPAYEFDLGFEPISNGFSIGNDYVINAFALDPSNIEFERGAFTLVAMGTKLWKCEEWDFEMQSCYGEWAHIMDTVPGQLFEVEFDQLDPGYAQTGVSPVNTLKPAYLPGEEADIMIVVLDSRGFPVTDADVALHIISPEGKEYFFNTDDTITSETRGIYHLIFRETNEEGQYILNVRAQGLLTDTQFSSYFEVKNYIMFDILRKAPIIIDPWSGSYTSEIAITSNDYYGLFSYYEIVPSSFAIHEADGAEIIYDNDNIIIAWHDITNGSTLRYSFTAPPISPAVHMLGESYVLYENDTLWIQYKEARPWYIAADPAVYYDPIRTIADGWSSGTGTTHIEIDDGVRQPNVPNTADYVSSAMNANEVSTFGFQNITQRGITGITLWVFTGTGNTATYTFSLLQGTTSRCSNTVPGNTGSEWRSCTWSTVSGDLSDMRLNLGAVTRATGGAGTSALVYSAYLEINYDEPPNVTLNSPLNSSIVENSTAVFNFTVSDDTGSTLPSCTLYANFSGSFAQNNSISSVPNGTWSVITVNNIPEGPWIWNINCSDNAGNSAFAQNNYTVRINAHPPSVTNAAFNESEISQGAYINISMTITDYWGIDYAEAAILPPNGTERTYQLTNSNDIYWIVIDDTEDVGRYNLTRVFANDTLSKNSTYYYDDVSFSVTAEQLSPFNLLYPANNTVSYNTTPHLEWEATSSSNFDNYTIQFSTSNDFSIVSYEYYAYDIAVSNYTIQEGILQDSKFYWRVIAYDIYGNSRESEDYFLYITDNTPPAVILNAPPDGSYATQMPVIFNATAADINGIGSCAIYTNYTGSWEEAGHNDTVQGEEPVTFSISIGEGPLLWNVLCTDYAGNSAFADSNRTLIADLSGPEVSLISPLNETVISSTNTITFNASAYDAYSELDSCSLKVNGTVKENNNDVDNIMPFSFITFLLNDYYYWQVNCTDIHGFEGVSDTYYFEVLVTDSDPPFITLNSPLNSSYINDTTIAIYYTPEDATGIDSCTLYINDTINQTDYSAANLVQNNFTLSGLDEGVYSWRVECTDSTPEENIGVSQTYRFIVDTTPPEVTLNAPDDMDFRNSITVGFNATATDINVSHCELYTNSSEIWAYASQNINIVSGASFVISGSVVEGPIVWNVLCYDQAGNSAFASSNRTVNIDVTAPILSGFSSEPSSPAIYSPDLNVLFNVTVTDSFSGVNFVEFEHNAFGGFQIFNATHLGGNVYTANLSGLKAQSFSYRWRARDNANNNNNSVYMSYAVTKANPNLNIYLNETDSDISVVEEETVAIMINMTQPPSQNIGFYINSNLIAESHSPISMDFSNELPGVYDITARVNETENYTAMQITRFITINDTRGPIITLLLPENNSIVGVSNVIFSYNVSDASAIMNCSLIINDTIDQTGSSIIKGTTQFFAKTLTDDYYRWKISCYDTYNNYAESDTRYFTLQESDKVNIAVQSDKSLYEQGEMINVEVMTYDDFSNPMNASTVTDVFKGLGERPWWNISYTSRYGIIVNESSGSNMINGIIEANLTGFHNSISDCRHIRIVGHHGSIMTPTSFGVYDGDNSTWCHVLFTANITANSINDDTYYAYCNTSSPTLNLDVLPVIAWQNYYATVAAADEGTPSDVDNIIGNNDATYARMSQGGGGGTHSAHGRGFITGNPAGTIIGVQARYRYAVPSMCAACTWQLRHSVNDGVYEDSFSGIATTTQVTSDWTTLTSTYTTLSWESVNSTRLQGRMTKTGGGGTGTLDLYWVEMNVTYKIPSDISQSQIGDTHIFMHQDIDESGVIGVREFSLSSLGMNIGNYSIVGVATAEGLNDGINFTHFEVIQDTTDPIITLLYPENNSIIYGEEVNFSFIASDANIDACLLYVNNNIEYINSSPINGAFINLSLMLDHGSYNWSVECNDTSGNIGWSGISFFTLSDSSVIIDEVIITDPIILIAADTSRVYCNATVYGTVNSHTAYLYSDSSFAGDTESNFTHYTNSSCDYNSNLFSCSFDLMYYAVNGSWHCTFNATGYSNSDSLSNSTIVEPLIALGVNESIIDYLNVSPADTSEIVEVRVYNYGNQPMDLRLYGYGATENDGVLMECPTSFIPESYQRFSINSAESFEDMTNLSANSNSPNVLALNLGTGDGSSITSYWRLQVPQLLEESQCQGSVVFVATQST
jgi:hypothetical protein